MVVVPFADIKLVVRRKDNGFLDGGLLLRDAHRDERQEGATVIGVGQNKRLNAREGLRWWEFTELWIVKRLQVENTIHTVFRERWKDIISKISLELKKNIIIEIKSTYYKIKIESYSQNWIVFKRKY